MEQQAHGPAISAYSAYWLWVFVGASLGVKTESHRPAAERRRRLGIVGVRG
jgi:hypothetical protein